jgi:hypothetical protein
VFPIRFGKKRKVNKSEIRTSIGKDKLKAKQGNAFKHAT